MPKIVRLPGRPELWDDGLLKALFTAPRCFHADPEHPTFSSLRERGVECEPLLGAVPSGSAIVVVASPLEDLRLLTDRLLGPGGCPWDQAQTHESLKKYLLEETYEVLDAIDSKDADQFKEELGDLMLQPIIHAQMQKLQGEFDSEDVARGVVDKLIRRHPHVFGQVKADNPEQVLKNWDEIKRLEKGGMPKSILAGVPKGMASLLRAHEVSKRAVRVGFEWPNIEAVFEKLHEEENELRAATETGIRHEIEAEIGDLLFTAVNIARWLHVEPEEALRKMLNRFTERFMAMERTSAKPLSELTPEEWDALWEAAKADSSYADLS